MAVATGMAAAAPTADVRLLTAGAVERVVRALVAQFEQQTGHRVAVAKDTAGALTRRIEQGEAFDVVVTSRAAIEALTATGKVAAGSVTPIAKVGVGVMVKAGRPVPDVSTVAAFKQAVLGAKSIAYIDPESGGSSGIYVAQLLDRLGIADAVRAKTKLKRGGHVADLIAGGEAELGIHQISEILPAAAVTLAGPLPAEIQNYTTYAAGVATSQIGRGPAEALVSALGAPEAAPMLLAKGMSPP